jgi:hypothetical protein
MLTAALSASCADDKFLAPATDDGEMTTFILCLSNARPDTRLAFAPDGDAPAMTLKSVWTATDKITVTYNPGATANAKTYSLIKGAGTATGTFAGVRPNISGQNWTFFYPSTITTDYQYLTHSYAGQVQTGDDNHDHLDTYFSMRYWPHPDAPISWNSSGGSIIPFSGTEVTQSSAMRLALSGLPEAVTPAKVSVSMLDGNGFLNPDAGFRLDNALSSAYVSEWPIDYNTATLDLDLSGFSPTTSLTAWMAMSNADVSLAAGNKLRVTLTTADGRRFCADRALTSAATLTGGSLHSLSLTSGWTEDTRYTSTDYSADGSNEVWQDPVDAPLDLVLMGDGFTDADIVSGDYDATMERAATYFFAFHPYKALRDYFRVAYVRVVSPQKMDVDVTGNNGATGKGVNTALSSYLAPNSTHMGGDNAKAINYALTAVTAGRTDEQLNNLTVIVVVNAAANGGTCWMFAPPSSSRGDYGKGISVSYFPRNPNLATLRATLAHEAGGHGFGKLGDEYTSNRTLADPTSTWNSLNDTYHPRGWYVNVAKYVSGYTIANTPWANFAEDSRYAAESLGAYQNAYTYDRDFCRPTNNGIMNSHYTPANQWFNAPSRRAIWRHVMTLAGEPTTMVDSYEAFATWDVANRPTTGYPGPPAEAAAAPLQLSEVVHEPPVVLNGYIRNGRFVTE